MSESTYLVTGALGCIGAWTVYHLVKAGKRVVSFDLVDHGPRLDLLLTPQEQAAIAFVRGDLADPVQVLDVFKTQGITHVIHLAALQVPFCRADPIKGAQVNVVGTVNVFEAARQTGVTRLTYASSIAVYGPQSLYPRGLVAHDAPLAPGNLYGVYKQANEGLAQVYWQEHHLSSMALRPYTVYGVGRDQGMTSDPTRAMLAAVAGRPFHIAFGGTTQLQLASDVALQFIEAANSALEGAHVFNLGGEVASIQHIIDAILAVKPHAEISFTDTPLPYPDGFDDSELRRNVKTVYSTPVVDGIRQTIQHFETCLADGRLKADQKI